MDKKLTLICFSICIALSVMAQGEATHSINEIKKQGDIYLYAESTSQTWEEALDNAKYLLSVEIETWVKSLDKKPAESYVAEAQNHIFNLQSMRGDRYRAFVYVKKSDIMQVKRAKQLVVVPTSEEQKTTIREVTQIVQTTPPSYKPTKFEEEMMSITDANNIGSFIKRLESDGKVIRYGKYRDMPADIDCYLFVYNREMNISAYLHKQGQTYINLKTGKHDLVTNYKGCGAWWFQLN